MYVPVGVIACVVPSPFVFRFGYCVPGFFRFLFNREDMAIMERIEFAPTRIWEINKINE